MRKPILLICLLHVCCLAAQAIPNPFVTPFSDVDITMSECPEWLREYVTFHKNNRGKPGAKYLVFTCNADKHWCGGLGKCTACLVQDA
jgi:hypothetical protein